MSETLEDAVNNPLLEFSVKLCAAVKKEKCLYDRTAMHKNTSPDIEAAWIKVAKELNETIEYCKYRWRSMFKSFYQNYRRSRNYYLHNYMTFLLEEEEEKTTAQDRESLNDDRNSLDKYNDDVSHQESEMDTLNMDDEQQRDTDSDSQTASADEINENSNGKTKEKLRASKMEEELDEKRKRLPHKRACKRGLDPELINELADESTEEKRPRRSLVERHKSFTQLNEKSTPLYKVDSKTTKIKPNKAALARDLEELKNENFKTLETDNKTQANKIKEVKKMVDRTTSTNIKQHDVSTQYEIISDTGDVLDEIFLNSIKLQLKQMNGRQKMNFKSKIYHALMEVFDDVNDFPQTIEIVRQPANKVAASSPPPLFVNTTTGELRLMRELASLVQAAKSTPEIVKAQDMASAPAASAAAGSINKTLVKDKSTTSATQNTEAANNSSSPLSPPALEEDDDLDFNLTTENLDEDEDLRLPRSLDEIMVKTSDNRDMNNKEATNVMGLPRHVLQKVVKVAGPSGSTIVAHNGDKKRIYRIYPKIPTVPENRFSANKNPSSVGTFYVAPPKAGMAQTSQGLNKANNSSAPTISVKNFANKSANVANAYPNYSPTTSSLTNAQQNHGNQKNFNNAASAGANKKISTPTLYKAIQPANRILNASTGLFQTINSSPSPSPPSVNQNNSNGGHKSNQSPATNAAPTGMQNKFNNTSRTTASQQNSMLPPSSHTMSSFLGKKPMQVRSHINLQRRFSICGALSTEKPNYTSMPMPPQSSQGQGQGNAKKSSHMPALASPIQVSKSVAPSKTSSKTTNCSITKNSVKTSEAANQPLTATKSTAIDSSKAIESPTKTSAAAAAGAAASVTEESSSSSTAKETEEMPIVETAGTITADSLDPLYVKQTAIKAEPLDD